MSTTHLPTRAAATATPATAAAATAVAAAAADRTGPVPIQRLGFGSL